MTMERETPSREYNPLDYSNLTRNCVEELMRRGPFNLPLDEEFVGAGVYALFYRGALRMYAKVQDPACRWPIYVGKAVPPGARKGAKRDAKRGIGPALHARLSQHCGSIEAARNLSVADFSCRYLVVTPLWITMAERFLIEHYQPIWNVCIEGFGNHDPGAGRHAGEVSWWDVLHPGRKWAEKLQRTRTESNAKLRLATFMRGYSVSSKDEALAEKPGDSDLAEDAGPETNEE